MLKLELKRESVEGKQQNVLQLSDGEYYVVLLPEKIGQWSPEVWLEVINKMLEAIDAKRNNTK